MQLKQNLHDRKDGHNIEINLNDAISYNSLVELKNVFTARNPVCKKLG